jgi:hypothetical protein
MVRYKGTWLGGVGRLSPGIQTANATQDGWVTNSDILDVVQSSDHLNYDNSVVKHLH